MLLTLPCEQLEAHPDFRPLASIAGLAVDLRYTQPNNFMGRDMYSPLDCSWAHRDAVTGLLRGVTWQARQKRDAHLCVLDALRPQRVQEAKCLRSTM